MKNLHLLPTDKHIKNVGDLVKDKYGDIHIFTKNDGKEYGKTTTKLNIYITNDETIKDGDYVTDEKGNIVKADKDFIFNCSHEFVEFWKKIILTTDSQLIADSVQAIDDTFLEWFVKNPSCEEVETFIDTMGCSLENCNANPCINYKIIIPKEEPKQETLEEACTNWANEGSWCCPISFEAGANWQAERMYSEEEVLELLKDFNQNAMEYIEQDERNIMTSVTLKKWFKQFKK